MRIIHKFILVEYALYMLEKGVNLFDCTISEAKVELLNRQAREVKYISGCDNEDEEGKCKGHEPKK